jgi:hypothetical protein
MRFIDNKGRLFGLVNVLDLAIVVLIVSVAGSMVFGLYLPKSCLKNETRTAATVMLKVIYYNVPKEIADNGSVLKPGNADIFGKAEIDKVLEVRPGATDRVRDVIVLIKTQCAVLDNQYYCGNVVIKLGMPFTFATKLYRFLEGTVVDMSISDQE